MIEMWYAKLRKLDHSFLSRIKVCIHHAKFTVAYVHVEKITLEKPKETFLYVMMTIKKPSKKSKPAAHLGQNIDHYFTWKILCNAPSNARTRKNIEGFFIAILRPNLNEQTDSDALILFRNGVT